MTSPCPDCGEPVELLYEHEIERVARGESAPLCDWCWERVTVP